MLVIGKFVFLCTLLALQIHGQKTGNLQKPDEYLTKVVDALWVKIKQYGISNLPVLDTVVNYNFNSFGVELIGPISFEDGFVEDIDLVSLSPQNFLSSADTTVAMVKGYILFSNLRLYRDFRADLTTGMKIGTTIVTPTVCSYELTIKKLHGNDTVVPTLSFYNDNTYVWDMDPDDLETRLIVRQFETQRKPVAGEVRPELVRTTTESWIPLFTKFLNEIVLTIEFPDMTFA